MIAFEKNFFKDKKALLRGCSRVLAIICHCQGHL